MIILVIPVAALGLALVWVRWARRPEKELDPVSQVEAHRRALAALAPRRPASPVARVQESSLR